MIFKFILVALIIILFMCLLAFGYVILTKTIKVVNNAVDDAFTEDENKE